MDNDMVNLFFNDITVFSVGVTLVLFDYFLFSPGFK